MAKAIAFVLKSKLKIFGRCRGKIGPRYIHTNTKSKPKNLRSHSSDVPDFEVLDMTRSATDTRQKIKDSLGIG